MIISRDSDRILRVSLLVTRFTKPSLLNMKGEILVEHCRNEQNIEKKGRTEEKSDWLLKTRSVTTVILSGQCLGSRRCFG